MCQIFRKWFTRWSYAIRTYLGRLTWRVCLSPHRYYSPLVLGRAYFLNCPTSLYPPQQRQPHSPRLAIFCYLYGASLLLGVTPHPLTRPLATIFLAVAESAKEGKIGHGIHTYKLCLVHGRSFHILRGRQPSCIYSYWPKTLVHMVSPTCLDNKRPKTSSGKEIPFHPLYTLWSRLQMLSHFLWGEGS
jgi:hypothetical protein